MRKHIPALMSEQKHNAHLQSKDDTSPNTPRPVEEETGEQHRSRLTAHTMQRLPPRAISHTLRSPRPWHRCQLELQSVHRHARTAAGVHVYAGLLCSAAGWLEARVPGRARYRRYGQDAERRHSFQTSPYWVWRRHNGYGEQLARAIARGTWLLKSNPIMTRDAPPLACFLLPPSRAI